jgi:hypothetical protein
MFRKSLIAATGFLGLFLAGTAAGATPASAGYACGPWNNWCRPGCAPWNGWCAPGFFISPGYGFSFGYNKYGYNRYWGRRPSAYRHGHGHSPGKGNSHGHRGNYANKGNSWK